MSFRDYYQFQDANLPCCLSVFHSLLHIPQSIRECGPPPCYWQFPMERFCGVLLPKVKSKRLPYKNLVNNLHTMRLFQIFPHLKNYGDTFKTTTPGIQRDNSVIGPNNRIFQLLGRKTRQGVLAESGISEVLLKQYYRELHIKRNNLIMLPDQARMFIHELQVNTDLIMIIKP